MLKSAFNRTIVPEEPKVGQLSVCSESLLEKLPFELTQTQAQAQAQTLEGNVGQLIYSSSDRCRFVRIISCVNSRFRFGHSNS